ncbi:MAG: tetratricopeptide repeat protein, partial [Acidobacteriota bacterium]|nr:tetratricopeptide repeat protein [Acidobacteriota bacterium]
MRSLLSLSATLCLTLSLSQDHYAYSHSATVWKHYRPVLQKALSPLEVGETVEREIKGGEVHSFNLSLRANQCVRIVVNRKGIDLFVNVIAPERPAMKYENPAGARSPIFVLMKAEVPGTYTVEIHPIRKWLAAGRYEIRLEEVPSPNASDEKRLAAQQKVAGGRRHQLLDSANSTRAALTSYEEALALWQEADDIFQEANTLHLIAQSYKALRDLDKAEEYYKRALERRGDDREARAYTLLDRAEAYYAIKGPLASLSHYQAALDAFRDNNNHRGQALSLTQLALIYMAQNEWEPASEKLQAALDIDRREGDAYEAARVLNALGGVADNQGNPVQASEFYEQARLEFERMGDSARLGNMYINIGLHHDTLGEWREAFSNYDEALKLLAAGEAAGEVDHSFVSSKKASLFYNLGGLYASLGDYEKGLAYLLQSLALRAPNNQGPTLMWLGYAHVLAGKPAEAIDFCERAIKLQEPTKSPRIAQSYTVMGMAHDALGNHEKAIEYFDKALEIQQNPATLDLQGQAITLDKRGVAFAAMGAVVKGRKDLETALTLWRRFKDPNGEALSLFQLARIERDSGGLESALAYAEAATRLIEPLRTNAVGQQLRASYFANKVDYYELYIDLIMRSRKAENREERTITALEASEHVRARGFLDFLSESGFVSSTVKDPELAALIQKRKLLERSILAKTAQRSQALMKGRKAADFARIERDVGDLNLEQSSVEAQIQSQHPRYAALISSQPVGVKEIQQQLDSDTLLLEYALGEKRSYIWVVSQDSIKGFELPARDQIESAAGVVTEALTARNREVKGESFSQKTLRFDNAHQDYSEASMALSKMVLEPVASLLGQKRLVVVGDGTLQMVPFAALPVPGSSAVVEKTMPQAMSSKAKTATIGPRTLIDEHEIITLPSASVLALQRRELANRKPAPLAVAVLADPVFDNQDVRVARATANGNQHGKNVAKSGEPVEVHPKHPAQNSPATLGSALESSVSTKEPPLATALRDVGLDPDGELGRLALSRQEAMAIARAVPTSQSFTALDFKASRLTATSTELSKYRIIHFATHGILDLEHPELSGIVLSMVNEKGQPQDGYLRLHEIYNLN